MFGALNRFISRLDSDSPSNSAPSAENAFGFQVLKNADPNLEIEPWFDFILGINGRQIDNPDPHLLALEIRNCATTPLSLTLFSAKGSLFRTLQIPTPHAPALSLTLQWSPLSLTHTIWHILSVTPLSPASQAGILPQSDYILGTPSGGHLEGESALGELVDDHLNRPLDLWVYNTDYDVTRTVTITPSRGWGGEGALGCVLGFGALHRLPAPLAAPPERAGEALFEADGPAEAGGVEQERARFSNEGLRPGPGRGTVSTPSAGVGEFMIPAQSAALRSASASPAKEVLASRGRRKGPAGGARAAGGMDEYFKEGEEKSKEEDYVPASKSGSVGPPPKAGGAGPPPPPKAGKKADGGAE